VTGSNDPGHTAVRTMASTLGRGAADYVLRQHRDATKAADPSKG
jgi:hypothetical protein